MLRRDFVKSQLLSLRYSDYENLFIEDFPPTNHSKLYSHPILAPIIHSFLFPSKPLPLFPSSIISTL